MARVFLIFTILIGLGAAFLGFKTKQQADDLQTKLKATNEALSDAKGARKKAESDLKQKDDELTKAQADLKQKEEDLTSAQTKLTDAQTKLTAAIADVEVKAKEVADLKELMPKNEPGVDPKEQAEKLEKLNAELAKKETELAEAQQVQKSLQAKADEAEGKVAPLEQQIKSYKDNVTRNGLTGKVLAYNPGWNFVVLSLGDKAGVKAGAQLVVTRGGAMIGKVKVTTVEPSTSIADVLPGTVARGQTVQPGDSVIVEGTR
jgi:peptidoglycan hydrolase CwlO-like protein